MIGEPSRNRTCNPLTARHITSTERFIGKDCLITVAGLTALTLLSWGWILAGVESGMSTLNMSTFQFPPPVMDGMTMAWSPGYGALMLVMWWIMMIAMIVPSTAPMILLYGRVSRYAQKKGQMDEGVLPTFVFVLGYLIAWLGFSPVATGAQWGLEQAGLMHQMLMWSSSSSMLTGFLMIQAGLYQLTPLKQACFEHCRSPEEYLSAHWRSGRSGAFKMGLTHGAYCLGCFWVLMALLFAGGVMNLVWIAGLGIIVLIEKVTPWGHG
jgi:predicted metal-binding membrane protein